MNIEASHLPPWVLTGVIAIAALVAAFVFCRIGITVARRFGRSRPVAQALLAAAEEPGRLLISVFALQMVWNSAPDELYLLGSVRHVTDIAFIAALTWLGLRAVGAVGESIAVIYPANIADNLHARRIRTQTRVLTRTLMSLVVLLGVSLGLMTFPNVRQVGASLLASAGVAGIILGFAAKPVLGNLLAGLQIAFTQPFRIDDVVIVEGEWGRIEEITGNYVVVAIWDQRRLIVPLQWFIEKPFQNWTRTSSEILGTVFLWVDYRMPVDALRAEVQRVCEAASEWDKRVCLIQVTDADEHAMQLRVLVSSADASRNWDLRCRVRERLIAFMQQNYASFLPRLRIELERGAVQASRTVPPEPPIALRQR